MFKSEKRRQSLNDKKDAWEKKQKENKKYTKEMNIGIFVFGRQVQKK